MEILSFLTSVITASVVNTTSIITPLKPKALNPGDTVAFISPATSTHLAVSNIEEYKKNLRNAMEVFGLKVIFSPNAFENGPSRLAGNDSQRAEDIMWAFKNPDVNAIIANNGGWGCLRIIDKLDYAVIKQNPKILMGYSDLTACTLAVNSQTDMVTFNGPMGASNWSNLNAEYMKRILIDAESNYIFSNPPDGPNITTIVPGKARGRLLGGTLTIINAMLGSKYLPSWDEPYILFLEDKAENSYRIDRLLTTLHLAGIFQNAKGLIWGTCVDCPPEKPESWTVLEVVEQKWGELKGIPSFAGAMIGHFEQQFTLPIGVQVEMDADKGTITLLEPGVIKDVVQ